MKRYVGGYKGPRARHRPRAAECVPPGDEPSDDPVVLYGLLTASDAVELARRRLMFAVRRAAPKPAKGKTP